MSRERKKIVAHIRARAAEIAKGPTSRVTAQERSLLKRRLESIAEEIEQGLHL
jgi:hypothetical protein